METVNDLMTVNVMSVSVDTTLNEVWLMMREEGFRQLPITENGRLVGIITERDLRMLLNTDLFTVATATLVMTEDPITVSPDTPLYKAAEMLFAYKFGALPVVDDGNLVGIISVSDFLEFLAAPPPFANGEKRLQQNKER